MKDSPQNKEDIEQTLASIWKEFAWYLKEVAIKHDKDIQDNRERIIRMEDQVTRCLEKIDNKFDALEQSNRTGWTVAEKIIGAIVVIVTIGISIIALLI